MSNGIGATECAAPSQEGTFFDKTENNYRNMETRARELISRIDNLCDNIGGGQPREAIAKSGNDQERHPAAFDRCNHAESNMYGSMNMLEESVLRLESLGLT